MVISIHCEFRDWLVKFHWIEIHRETTSSSRSSQIEFDWMLKSVGKEKEYSLCLLFSFGVLFFGRCWKPSTLLGGIPASAGSLCLCLPSCVPGMVGERSHRVTEPELGDLLLLITAFTALQRLCVIGALYATKHYFSLIAALSKIAGDHLRQCWNRNSGSADWSLCILTDHAFQNETPVYEIRLKSR